MTAPITDLAAAVAALGALPVPAGPADSAAELCWLLAHPEAATHGRHATPGEAAEQRHLLDPALDYTRRQETK